MTSSSATPSDADLQLLYHGLKLGYPVFYPSHWGAEHPICVGTLFSEDGDTLVSEDGGTPLSEDGGTLVSKDGGVVDNLNIASGGGGSEEEEEHGKFVCSRDIIM